MSSTLRRGMALASACAAVLAIAGCGQSDGKGGNGNPLSGIMGSASSESEEQKFSAYTEAFNALIHNNWGISNNYQIYEKLNIPSANASGTIQFPESITSIERAIENLKKGRALKGGSGSTAADAAADKIITNGDALLVLWKDLQPYYESRRYQDDGLAKGKASHAALMTAYQNTLAGIDELDTALTTYLRAESTARIEGYRKAGQTEYANLLVAMQKADLLSSAAIEKNTAEADRLLPELEAAMAELRKSEAAMQGDARQKTTFDMISGRLDSMVGAYREYKAKPNDTNLQSIIRHYNSATNEVSDVEFPA